MAGGTLLAAPVFSPLTGVAFAQSSNAKPKVVLNVRDFGAAGDGTTKDTVAIQQALDRCAVLGGGEVLVPAGNYLTGALALRSNALLRLEKDAGILGSPDFADYPVTQVRWEGKWIQGRTGLVYAIGASIQVWWGLVKSWAIRRWAGVRTAQNPLRHPALIEPIGCKGVRLEDSSTDYRLMWSIHPTYCEDVTCSNLTIRSTGGNGDGIDIDSCKRVRIDRCDISTGDDCIAIKSGRGAEAYASAPDHGRRVDYELHVGRFHLCVYRHRQRDLGRHSECPHRAVQVHSRADLRDLHQDSRGPRARSSKIFPPPIWTSPEQRKGFCASTLSAAGFRMRCRCRATKAFQL